MQKTAKFLIFTGLWAVLLIPFIVSNNMFFPFITGKNFLWRIIVEIILALWIYLAYVKPEYRPKLSWISISVGIFVAVMLVADIFAVNPAKAFWSNFERMDGWVTLIHLLAYLLVFGSMMKTEKLWLWFFRSSVFAGFIMSFYVLNEWLKNGTERVSITLGNPIYVAVYFLFNFFLVLILLYKDVIIKTLSNPNRLKAILGNWFFYVYIILAALFVFDIWRTGTRGVIIGLVGGLIISGLITAILERSDKLVRKSSIGLLIVIALLIGGFFAVKDTKFVKSSSTLERLSQISWSNMTGQGQARQYVWPMAIKGFQEKPILGWGQDGFNYVFNKYYDPRMYSQEQWFDRAHNMPLDMLVAGGILGLISYLFIFIAALVVIWKRRQELGITDAALLLGLLAGYFAQNLFVFDNLVSYIYFFVILSYIYSKDMENKNMLSKEDTGKHPFQKIVNMEVANYIVVPIILVVFAGTVYFVNWRPFNANTNLIGSLRQNKEGLAKNLEYFNKALSYNSFGDAEIREQLLNVTQQVVPSQVDPKVKEAFASLAYSEIQKQIEIAPNDSRYRFFAGIFLNKVGQYTLAMPQLEKAVELSPKKQTMIFELAKNYAYLGLREKALEMAKFAYNLENNFADAKILYAAMLILNGREGEAKTLMGGASMESDVIIRAYLLRAQDYLRGGNKDAAISEVKRAVQTAPGFETQSKEIIDGILKGTVK